jgi:cell division protein FtsW
VTGATLPRRLPPAARVRWSALDGEARTWPASGSPPGAGSRLGPASTPVRWRGSDAATPARRRGAMAAHSAGTRAQARATGVARRSPGLGITLRTLLGGEATPVGRALEMPRQRHQPEYLVVLAVVALTAVGILMVYSSSAISSYVAEQDTLAVVGPQLVWAVLGVAAMVVLMRVDYRILRYLSVPMYAAALVMLVLVLLPGIGIRIGGSARWLQIGPLPAIHPAEFAKLALVVYLAHWFSRRETEVGSFRRGTIPFLLIAGPLVALVLGEPDLGTSGVVALSAVIMFFAAGANLWQFVVLIPAGVAAATFVVLSNPYQLDRVRAFLDPWRDTTGIGFHTVQGLLALGLGGVIGTGLGSSRTAGALYLPNASNDFIFAIIGQEFGLLGGALVVGLFLLFAWQGMRVAMNTPDTFGGLLAAGITAWISFQALINIGVVVALIPITGITLPFISAGGSSLTISLAAVGILLSVSRETQPRGNWTDADPDRGGRHGRARLPGPGRRALADEADAAA